MKVDDYFSREKKVFIALTPMLIGLGLLCNHYIAFGGLSFWDGFPSHESTGTILVLSSLTYIFAKMFNYELPQWLRDKNNSKFIGKLINKIIKK